MDEPSPYLTKAQARRYLGGDDEGGVSADWLERSKIRRFRVGRMVRYLRGDLDAFMARHAIEVRDRGRGRATVTTAPRARPADAGAPPPGWLESFGRN